MNMQVLDARRDTSGGYKVDFTRGDDIRVGTVDKFQGQEAPVCLVSMTASSVEETPRGMDFLFSLNRINVAVSRAEECRMIHRIKSPMELVARTQTEHDK